MPSRAAALDRFRTTPSGREKAGRYWKVDLDAVDPGALRFDENAPVAIENPDSRAYAADLATARVERPNSLADALGKTSATVGKFGALTRACSRLGAFIHVPADVAVGAPIVVTYRIPPGAAVFPHTVLYAERGARVTLVERFEGGQGSFVSAVTEIVTQERAEVEHAAVQSLESGARAFFSRSALPGRDSRIVWNDAQIGADLAVVALDIDVERPGVEADINALFFPTGNQHVDAVSTVAHAVGDSRSHTLVKSAASGRGQARYLGNIHIAKNAQGSDASLRDDALLLSKDAHVDSIPALEIAANDVKAFHGATVGALDAEQIFYMGSRGIPEGEAERMIALGFFEPVVERFPGEALREELREALRSKLG